ncbi:MAG: hypothetical protein KDI13_10930 [Alphaproteobacteria bacterium]|nr:hypothetical protein [Alphaproteobacteria bacterium]
MAKKILLSLLGLLAGPAAVLGTMPLYNWSLKGGLITMAIVSFIAVQSVWTKSTKNTDTKKEGTTNEEK